MNAMEQNAVESMLEQLRDERDELSRKLSCAEAELIRQTGCTAENVASIYNLPIPKPIVNARMGESHRLRFEAEDENARLRAQVAELVNALRPFANYFDGKIENVGGGTIVAPQFAIQHFKDAQAAIAAAEGSKDDD